MRSAQASIQKLDDRRWRIRVEAPRDPRTGKRRQLSKTVRGSRKDAEKAKHELLIKAGVDGVCTRLTLSEYAWQVFFPEQRNELAQLTVEAYERRFRLHVEPALGNKVLPDITAHDLRRWLPSVGKPTVQKEARKVLNALMQHAVYNGHLEHNPCRNLKPPKVEKYRPEVLDAQDVEVYLWHFKNTWSEPAVLLAIGAGLRRGEIIALDVDDVDAKTGAVKIESSIVPTAQGAKEKGTKTENGVRTVHLPRSILARLLEVMPESGAIVRNQDGTRMRPDVLTHRYEKDRATLPDGVPRISLKNLRHTSLTLAFDSGADLLDVSRRAGHSSTTITADYYVRPKGERDMKAAEMMDEKLR